MTTHSAVSAPLLTVLFSRDRALQLDATIRSFYLHCEDAKRADLRVLYSASDERHERQYQDVHREHARGGSLSLLRERDFRLDLLRILADAADQGIAGSVRRIVGAAGESIASLLPRAFGLRPDANVLFLVDDNLFVRPFRLEQIERALATNPDALGFSLRLGRNTTHCYALDRAQRTPEFSLLPPGILAFDWTSADADFGYPLEVSSSVYRLRDILPLIASVPFRNPNTLESELASRSSQFCARHPTLLSFETSVTFCNPVNKVQTEFANRAGADAAHSSEGLADLFSKGYRIDVSAYQGMIPTGCHEEVGLRFVEGHR